MRLDFEPPDFARFDALQLGLDVARAGGTAGAVLNGANEAAVAAFLDRRIGFLDITATVAETVEHMHARGELAGYGGSDVLETATVIDKRARSIAAGILNRATVN